MRLAQLRKLNKEEHKKEYKKAVLEILEAQKILEENGTFTFYDSKKNGGLVMEYIPKKPLPLLYKNEKTNQ